MTSVVHMPNPVQLTAAQVATRHGLSRWTVTRALNAGELEGSKVGSQWVTTDEAVGAWLAQRAERAEVAS